MNKRYYEHTLPIIRGSLSNTYLPFIENYRHNSHLGDKVRKFNDNIQSLFTGKTDLHTTYI